MAQVDAWVPVAGSAITAVAALGSVALAQRSTRRRDQDTRLWERRSGAYVDAIRWVQSVLDVLPTDDDERPPKSVVLTDDLLPPSQLRAEIAAFASTSLHRSVDLCVRRVSAVVKGGEAQPIAGLSLRSLLETTLEYIRDDIQGEDYFRETKWDRITMRMALWLDRRWFRTRRAVRQPSKPKGDPPFRI